MTDFPLAPCLPDDVLDRQRLLPVKPSPVTLTGRFVRLEPLHLDRDVPTLYAVSNGEPAALGERSINAYDADQLVWRYLPGGPFASAMDLSAYLRLQVNADNGLALCVFDVATNKQVGVVTYMNNFPAHLKIELGNIWYSPLVQRTKASLESTYLLLSHAFDLGYRRLEWKCDAFNERSRRSALRMGFKFEGIHECHFIIKGRNRDTAWFRILDREWTYVKSHLESLLKLP